MVLDDFDSETANGSLGLKAFGLQELCSTGLCARKMEMFCDIRHFHISAGTTAKSAISDGNLF